MTSRAANVQPKTLVDLEAIIKKWAWKQFDKDRTWKQRNLKFNQLDFQIDWKNVTFVHCEPDYSAVTDIESCGPNQKAQILFKTQFLNNTNQEQEYSFKTERSTRSSCTVEVEKGVCTGYEVSVSLKTPLDILEANAGFKSEMHVNITNTQAVEESVTWSVDSQIKVKPTSKTTALLVVDEKSDKREFTIQSFVFGNVTVTVTNRAKNHRHVTCAGGPIVEIVNAEANEQEKAILRIDRTMKQFPHSVIVYQTHGQCVFKFGVEQRVELEEIAI